MYRVDGNFMLDGVADFPERSFRTQFPLILKQDYVFVVKAFNIIGESAKSEPITIRAAREPEAPVNLRLEKSKTSCSQITVKWDSPDDNGADISEYKVWYFPGTQQLNRF